LYYAGTFWVSRIKQSKAWFQNYDARILKLARTYAKSCEKDDDVVGFWIGRVVVADVRMITRNSPIWGTHLDKTYNENG
jgi:hypothetical protein